MTNESHHPFIWSSPFVKRMLKAFAHMMLEASYVALAKILWCLDSFWLRPRGPSADQTA